MKCCEIPTSAPITTASATHIRSPAVAISNAKLMPKKSGGSALNESTASAKNDDDVSVKLKLKGNDENIRNGSGRRKPVSEPTLSKSAKSC